MATRLQYGWSELRSLVNAELHYIDAPRAELYGHVADPRETAVALVLDLLELDHMPKIVLADASVGRLFNEAVTRRGALGVLAYAMLTGHEPFTGENPVSIAYKQVHDAPQPLNQIVADVPLCSLLSGGLDSSIITALASKKL